MLLDRRFFFPKINSDFSIYFCRSLQCILIRTPRNFYTHYVAVPLLGNRKYQTEAAMLYRAAAFAAWGSRCLSQMSVSNVKNCD